MKGKGHGCSDYNVSATCKNDKNVIFREGKDLDETGKH